MLNFKARILLSQHLFKKKDKRIFLYWSHTRTNIVHSSKSFTHIHLKSLNIFIFLSVVSHNISSLKYFQSKEGNWCNTKITSRSFKSEHTIPHHLTFCYLLSTFLCFITIESYTPEV